MVKYQLGKPALPEPPETYGPVQRVRHRIDALDLDESNVRRLSCLPNLHRDPFDRMLIFQVLEHDLVLVTVDEQVQAYPVATC